MAPDQNDSIETTGLDDLLAMLEAGNPEATDIMTAGEAGKESGEGDVDKVQTLSARRLREQERMASVSAGLQNTPREEQTPGFLGIEDVVAFKRLPKGSKIIEITVPTSTIDALHKALERLNLTRHLKKTEAPIKSPTDPTPETSDLTTEQFLVTSDQNALELLSIFQRRNEPAHITLYNAPDVPVLRINEHLLPIHAHIAAPRSPKDPRKDIFKTLDVVRPSGETTTITQASHTTTPKRFPAIHATVPSVMNTQARPEIPNNRSCTFLIIDINKLAGDEKSVQAIAEVTSRLSRSKDFQFTTDQDGNLVIIALAERAGGVLGGRWAKSIEEATNGTANMYLGFGTIKQEEGATVIEQYPTKERRETWQSMPPTIYTDTKQAENLGSGRNASLYQLEFGPTDQEGLSIVSKVERGAKKEALNVIGRDEIIARILKILSSEHPARALVFNGVAGVGKTTILEEIERLIPSTVLIRMDSTGEGLPGEGIIQFSEELATVMVDRLSPQMQEQYAKVLEHLYEFTNKPVHEKLDVASSRTETSLLKNTCLEALKILEIAQGAFPLIIDDTHHIDRASDDSLMEMAYEFNTESDSKVVVSQRHEERFRAEAQRTFVKKVNALRSRNTGLGEDGEERENVETILVEILDFTNPEIAKPYAKRFVPKELLTDASTGKPREIGDWILELAKGTGMPITMDDRLIQLASNPRNFIPGEDEIGASPEVIAEILVEAKKHSDLGVLLARRIEKLDPNNALAFQLLAIPQRTIKSGDLRDLVEYARRRQIGKGEEPEAYSIKDMVQQDYIVTADGTPADEVKGKT
ncbi:AAA family ATPase, partial [Candidatus Peregrinibacteria bacterium]|nr:AAA family ATPase [Candidatus Peregrinibacteria bacterium]